MKIFVSLTTLLFATIASAGVLVEPQLGYVLSNKFNGTVSLSGPLTATSTSDYKATGVEYGARLGYQVMGFMGGLNYGHMSGTSKNANGTKDDIKGNNLGVFAGFNAPILVRGWIAYNFSSKADVGSDKFKGHSTEIGLGFTGLPFLSVNAIYRMYNYTELTTRGQTYTASGLEPKEIELAISAPFNLF
ncbi:MAG: hypothetical protein ACXVLQ_03375 [Bacteriovorax sp.]